MVSSSYSEAAQSVKVNHRSWRAASRLTFVGIRVLQDEVEIGTITKLAQVDDLSFQLEDRDASTIERHPLTLLLIAELVEHRTHLAY